MVEVVLYGPVRDAVGEKRLPASGDTVERVLAAVVDENPELEAALYDGDAFRPEINVFVDGRKLATVGGLETTLEGDETVQITAAMSGGAT